MLSLKQQFPHNHESPQALGKSGFRAAKGFTIVELLIVVVVIAILATISIVSYNGITVRTRDDARTTDTALIKSALKSYYKDKGEYPPACAQPALGCYVDTLNSYLIPKYIGSIPDDPKAPELRYQYVWGSDGKSYALRIQYETKPTCKMGMNVPAGWWETSTPMC